jgi:hypothetical protein
MRRIALSLCVLFGIVTITCAWGPSGQRLFGEHCRTALAGAVAQYQTDPQAAVLIARWDNEAGAITNDTSGMGFHLTKESFNNTNVVAGTNQFGREERCWYLPRVSGDDYMSAGMSSSSAFSNAIVMLSFWRRAVDNQSYMWMFSYPYNGLGTSISYPCNGITGGKEAWALRVRTNATDITYAAFLGTVIPTNEWVHFSFLHDTAGVHCYTNGYLAVENTSAGGKIGFAEICRQSPTGVRLGFGKGLSSSQRDYWDNMRVYTNLTTSQAATESLWLFQNTNPTNCLEAR